MTLSPADQDHLRTILPRLVPQPYMPQLEDTLEFDKAQEKFKLLLTEFIFAVGLYKVGIMKDGEGPYWETLWANNGRPYVRIYDSPNDKSFDVFLLPIT